MTCQDHINAFKARIKQLVCLKNDPHNVIFGGLADVKQNHGPPDVLLSSSGNWY